MQQPQPQPPVPPAPQQAAKPEIIINQPESNSSLNFKGRNVLLSLAVFVLVSGVGVGVYLVDQRTNLLPQAKEISPTPVASQAANNPSSSNRPALPPRLQAGSSSALLVEESASPSATPVAQKGDGNNDGKIDAADLTIANSLRNKPASENPQLDINGDGIINSFDISALAKLINP